jgi:hypothetical protein
MASAAAVCLPQIPAIGCFTRTPQADSRQLGLQEIWTQTVDGISQMASSAHKPSRAETWSQCGVLTTWNEKGVPCSRNPSGQTVRSSTTMGASRVGGFATTFGTLGVSQNAGTLVGDSRVRREEFVLRFDRRHRWEHSDLTRVVVPRPPRNSLRLLGHGCWQGAPEEISPQLFSVDLAVFPIRSNITFYALVSCTGWRLLDGAITQQ